MRVLSTTQMAGLKGGGDCNDLLATIILTLAVPGGELVATGLIAAYVLKCTGGES